MTERSFTIPIADTGDGGHVAEIRVHDGELSWSALVAIAEVLRRSAAPITLSFAIERPNPIFVTIDEAAGALGVTPSYIETLAANGHLPLIVWNEGKTNEALPVDGKPPPRLLGWHKVVPWDDLAAFAEKVRADGHFPIAMRRVDKAVRPGELGPVTSPVKHVVGDVLRHAQAAGEVGMDKALTMAQIFDRVAARRRQKPNYRAVQAGVNALVREGKVKAYDRGYRPGQRGTAKGYEWCPEVVVLSGYVGKPIMTADTVKVARRLMRNGEATVSALARQAGVTRQAMHMAITGETWKELDEDEPPVVAVAKRTSARPKSTTPKRVSDTP